MRFSGSHCKSDRLKLLRFFTLLRSENSLMGLWQSVEIPIDSFEISNLRCSDIKNPRLNFRASLAKAFNIGQSIMSSCVPPYFRNSVKYSVGSKITSFLRLWPLLHSAKSLVGHQTYVFCSLSGVKESSSVHPCSCFSRCSGALRFG